MSERSFPFVGYLGRGNADSGFYYSQATVLVQVGLLDPKLVPGGKLAKRLPVVGREGATKVVDETVGESNKLIPGW